MGQKYICKPSFISWTVYSKVELNLNTTVDKNEKWKGISLTLTMPYMNQYAEYP